MSRAAYWLAAALLAGLVAAKFDPGTGFTGLLRFGSAWSEARMPALKSVVAAEEKGSGYDGQFYVQIALDPLLRQPDLKTALDAPAYRARRILLPAAVHVLALGHPPWIVQLFAVANLGAWIAVAIMLKRELGGESIEDFARWFACLFSLGALDSVRQSLVDLPAMALVLIAVRAARANRGKGVLVGTTLAALTKETSALSSLALAMEPRRLGRNWLLFIASLLPLLAWVTYVSLRLSPSGAGMGNFTWPLWGAATQAALSAREVAAGNLDSRHTFALLGIAGLLLQAIVILRLKQIANPWWRIGVAHAALLTVLGPWVWSGYWAACRALLPLTFAFNLLLPGGARFWPTWALGNLTLLHGVWRFL